MLKKTRVKNKSDTSDFISSNEMSYAYGILKRLHRRMQMRGVRLLQVAKKNKKSSVLLYRAYTWEEACTMLDAEMENIKCRIEKITQTLT